MVTFKRGLAHYALAVGYLLFFIAIMVGFIHLDYIQKQIERESLERAYVLCQDQNDVRLLLAGILDELAAPRLSDEPGDHEMRLELRNQVDPLIEIRECPPTP